MSILCGKPLPPERLLPPPHEGSFPGEYPRWGPDAKRWGGHGMPFDSPGKAPGDAARIELFGLPPDFPLTNRFYWVYTDTLF